MKTRYLLIVVVVLFVSSALATQSYAKIDPKTVVGLWLFDDGNGKVAKDSSGNKIDGALNGNGLKWVDGKSKPGKALQFDGSGYVLVHVGAALPGSLTLAAWIYPTAGGGVVFAELGQGTVNSGWHDSQMEVLTTGEIKVGYWTGAENGISLGKFAFNKWYNVVMVYDKSDTSVKGYINGALIESGKFAKQYTADVWYGIGAQDTTSLGNGAAFNGNIDEAVIFNVPLSAADVVANMNRSAAVSPVGTLSTTWAGIKDK